MPPILPAFSSTTVTGRHHLIDDTLNVPFSDAVIDSGVSDSGSTPTTLIRPGTVLVKRTSTGRYVAANDANADVPTQASVSSVAAAGATWASKIVTVVINGITIVAVTLGAADDTTAEVVTALNANAIFAANCIASGTNGNPVVIKTLRAGADVALKVFGDHADVFTVAGTFATGTDPDVIVTDAFAPVADENGTAVHAPVKALCAGYFDLSELIVAGTAGGLRTTAPIAYAVLSKLGSKWG